MSRKPFVHYIPISVENDSSDGEVCTTNKLKNNEKNTDQEDEVSNTIGSSIQNINIATSDSAEEMADSPKKTENIEIMESSIEEEQPEELPETEYPSYSVPEKIVIVFDRAHDDLFTNFELNNGNQYPPIHMLKNGLKFFLHNKSYLNSEHEFALVLLDESKASWVIDFTKNFKEILTYLQDVSPCEPEDKIDLGSIFYLINKHAPLFDHTIQKTPPYIVRTLFLYSRSYTIPCLEDSDTITAMLDSKYFMFDVCMTHEPTSSSNHAEKIFNILQKVDTKGLSYCFSVHRNTRELHIAMAKLLSHPLQRPYRCNADYTVNLKFCDTDSS